MRGLRLALLGAALAYLFDPQHGKARRYALAERLADLRRDRAPKPDLSEELAGHAHAVAD